MEGRRWRRKRGGEVERTFTYGYRRVSASDRARRRGRGRGRGRELARPTRRAPALLVSRARLGRLCILRIAHARHRESTFRKDGIHPGLRTRAATSRHRGGHRRRPARLAQSGLGGLVQSARASIIVAHTRLYIILDFSNVHFVHFRTVRARARTLVNQIIISTARVPPLTP